MYIVNVRILQQNLSWLKRFDEEVTHSYLDTYVCVSTHDVYRIESQEPATNVEHFEQNYTHNETDQSRSYDPYLIAYHEDTNTFTYNDPWIITEQKNDSNSNNSNDISNEVMFNNNENYNVCMDHMNYHANDCNNANNESHVLPHHNDNNSPHAPMSNEIFLPQPVPVASTVDSQEICQNSNSDNNNQQHTKVNEDVNPSSTEVHVNTVHSVEHVTQEVSFIELKKKNAGNIFVNISKIRIYPSLSVEYLSRWTLAA